MVRKGIMDGDLLSNISDLMYIIQVSNKVRISTIIWTIFAAQHIIDEAIEDAGINTIICM